MSSTPLKPSRRVKYVRLGSSGLKVSQIILGCMSYGSSEWKAWALDEDETVKHIKFAYDAGIQTFDTANAYSNGMSEVVLGKAIQRLQLPREEIVVMTKVFGSVGKTVNVNAMELFLAGPDNCGYASLKRLQLDYIDVLQVHRFDYETPIEETMQALHDVVKAGHVRYLGMSSCHAWQYYAITHDLTPFISMTNQYSLVYREEEREMMPSLKHFGVGSIPWSTLARGALSRPVPVGTDSEKQTLREATDDIPASTYFALGAGTKDVVNRVEEIAKKYGATMSQISLAWVMAKDGVTAPVVGTTSLEKLDDLLGALEIKLSTEDMTYLEEPYKPMKIFLYN
ncbi:Aldo/keto reductase [Mycena rosella]|uniref:Aldo/keto reductase n=1 Tax=Mycena rosella TaxID=1033263 RepID=A0AAD7DLP9_MYCRO|nr:Aldo/keto reductase [Mycena rosella]